jgi:hypothetical protein
MGELPLTEKEKQSLTSKIEKLLAKWMPILGITTNWRKVDIKILDESGGDGSDGSKKLAECWQNWPYKIATINFYLRSMHEENDDEVENVVVHELCHLLVGMLVEDKTDVKLMESTVVSITSAVISANKEPRIKKVTKSRGRKVENNKQAANAKATKRGKARK